MTRSRVVSAFIAVGMSMILGGCGMASNLPTYDDVSSDTRAAMQTVVDLLPEASVVTPRPEQEPYPCDDPVGVDNKRGAFYTGNWDITVPANFDIESFVLALPDTLGEGWDVVPSQIPVGYATVDILEEATSIVVTVSDASEGSTASLNIMGMSPCATTSS